MNYRELCTHFISVAARVNSGLRKIIPVSDSQVVHLKWVNMKWNTNN